MWFPKYMERFYYVGFDGKVYGTENIADVTTEKRFQIFNCYKDEAVAEVAAEQIPVLHKIIKSRFEGADPVGEFKERLNVKANPEVRELTLEEKRKLVEPSVNTITIVKPREGLIQILDGVEDSPKHKNFCEMPVKKQFGSEEKKYITVSKRS